MVARTRRLEQMFTLIKKYCPIVSQQGRARVWYQGPGKRPGMRPRWYHVHYKYDSHGVLVIYNIMRHHGQYDYWRQGE